MGRCGFCASHCEIYTGFQEDLGNGQCQAACDNEACAYDGGDCVRVIQGFCNSGCFQSMLGNGHCEEECFTTPCDYDKGDCSPCNAGCWPPMVGDGECNAECYTAECGWDDADCDCAPGCFPILLSNEECDEVCSTAKCSFDDHKCVSLTQGDCAAQCFSHALGDGHCDEECNTAECNWDGHDCECAPGCRYKDLRTCKAECMVPECGFSRMPGFASCSEFHSTAEIYHAILIFKWSNYFIFPLFNFELCRRCPFEQLFTQCMNDDFCSSLTCMSNFGLCESSPLPACEAFQSHEYGDICFKCREGFVNDFGNCRESCSPGLGLYPLLGNQCFPIDDDSTPERPDVFYVDDSGQYADFDQRLSYSSLSEAFFNMKKHHTRILLSGQHLFNVQQPSRFLASALHNEKPAVTFEDRTLNITIMPASVDCRASVRLNSSDPPQFSLNYLNFGEYSCFSSLIGSFTIERVDFTMDSEASCSFSSFLEAYAWNVVLRHVSFRGINGYNFIIVVFIPNDLTMDNVSFENITVSENVVDKSSWMCNQESEKPGTLSYTDSITSAVHATRFFSIKDIDRATVSGVTVQYADVTDFLSATGVRQVVLTDCRFLYNRFRGSAALQVLPIGNDYVRLYADYAHFDDPTKADILVMNSEFRSNEAKYCLCFDFGYFPQSVRVKNCDFRDEWHAILSVSKSSPVQDSDINGVGKYVNGVRRNADPIFVDLRNLRLQNCTAQSELISVANFSRVGAREITVTRCPRVERCATTFVFSKCFNVSVTSLFISDLQCDRGLLVLNSSSTTGIMAITSTLITRSSSEELLSISIAEAVIIDNLTITDSSAIRLVNLTNVSNLSMRFCLFESIAANETLFLCGAERCQIVESRFVRNQVEKGGVVQLPVSSTLKTSLMVENSSFDSNRAGIFGAIMLVQSTVKFQPFLLFLRFLNFTSNTAATAVVLMSGRTALTEDSEIQSCRFLSNTAGDAVVRLQYEQGALTISQSQFAENEGDVVDFAHSSVNLSPQLRINNTKFVGNNGSAVNIRKSLSGSVFSALNSVFTDCLGTSLFLQQTKGIVSNCTFLNNTAEVGGALVLTQFSIVEFNNCTFASNSAANTGGSVVISEGSLLVCGLCLFVSNSAATGGAIFISPGAAVELLHCLFEANSAVDGSALYSLMSAPSLASDCEFRHNRAHDEAVIAMFFSALTLRNCTVQENYCGQLTPGVVLSLSNLTVEYSTFASHRGVSGTLLRATMRSIVNISASEFTDIQSQNGAIYADDTVIDIRYSTFQSMSADSGSVIASMENSHLYFSDNTVKSQWNIRGGALYIQKSFCSVSNSRFSALNNSAVYSKRASIAFNQCRFYGNSHSGITAIEGGGLYCKDCGSVIITGCAFSGLKATKGAGVFLANSKPAELFSIENSTFQDNSAEESGGIHADMTDLKIKNCLFINNKAESRGGAVTLLCAGSCLQSVLRSQFVMNKANSYGGAISWQRSAPTLFENKYEKNTAPYGPDVSSFPTSLFLTNQSFPAVASGQVFPSLIVVETKDHYNQTVLIDNSTTAELTIISGEVLGAVTATADMGTLTFSGFSLVGRLNTTIHIYSAELQSKLAIDISFRSCIIGEYEIKNRCVVCGPGTYSVDPAQACTECDKNADCAGSYFLVPRPGYWRASVHSTHLYQCPNPDACLGAPDLTGTCATGYTGNMCQTCAVNYVRYVKTHCEPCPSQKSTILLTVGVTIGAVLFSVVQVVMSIKSAYKEKSQTSLSLKVLTNYIQLVMLMGSFNLNWPTMVKRFLNIQDSAGSFSDHIFAPGCLRSDYDENEDFYGKVVAMAFVPLGVLSLSSAMWALWALARRQSSIIRNELVASSVILFFLVHPSVIRVMLSALNCEEIDGKHWIVGLTLRCWQGDHWKYAVATALPSILLWGAGVPLLILLFLSRHNKTLQELQSRVRFGYLFNGYRSEKYYWEFIVIYRKLVVISLTVFLSRFPQVVPALATLAVLVLSSALQEAHKPFRLPSFNAMEQRSLFVSFVTLFCGLYFLFGGLSTVAEILFFTVIVAANIHFLQYWIRATFKTWVALIVSRLPCLRQSLVVLGEARVVTSRKYQSICEMARGTRYLAPVRKKFYFSRVFKQLA